MYSVDDRDTVIEVQDAPRPDVGAPLPTILADDTTLLLAYLVSEPDPNWDGGYATSVSIESEGLVAIVRFRFPRAHIFGPPNDEAFHGHPLAGRGLGPYAVWEVRHSSWIRQLERMNAVHPYHRSEQFAAYRHFIFAFHDSTFECVAEDFEVSVQPGSIRAALAKMVQSESL
jgi:hypothetical protein